MIQEATLASDGRFPPLHNTLSKHCILAIKHFSLPELDRNAIGEGNHRTNFTTNVTNDILAGLLKTST